MKTFDDFEIIDSHVHPFLETEGVNLGAYGAPVTPQEFVEELRSLGIRQCCGTLLHGQHAEWNEIRNLNDAALRFRDRFPDFYLPGIHIHARCPDESCRELERMHREGVRWIGELVPYLMGTGPFASPGFETICATAEELRMPINLHLHPETLADLEGIVRKFPNLPIVLAHPGDLGQAKQRVEFTSKWDNVYLDLSGIGLFRWNMLRWAIDHCGSGKLLFGSDFPICSPGMNLYGVLTEHLSRPELENIFSRNFRRLIHAEGITPSR